MYKKKRKIKFRYLCWSMLVLFCNNSPLDKILNKDGLDYIYNKNNVMTLRYQYTERI